MSDPDPTNTAVFYRWKDPQGLEHLVDSLDKVPEIARPKAERIALVASVTKEHEAVPATTLGGVRIDWRSFASGFGIAIVLAFAFGMARRAKRPVVEFAVIVAAAAAAGSIFYFGWVRQKTEPTAPERDVRSILFETGKITPDKAKRGP